MITPIHSQVDPVWLSRQFPDLTDLQVLATGGQKQVFVARHATDGEVVLKLMHPGTDPARTERELEAASRVQAPRMPRIFEHGLLTGNTGTIVWFCEQRVPGQALSARIQARALSHHELLRLALHVSETLVAAEAVSIVHRDVKPANIIVDSQGEFWLIDFGVARHLDLESLTATVAPGGLRHHRLRAGRAVPKRQARHRCPRGPLRLGRDSLRSCDWPQPARRWRARSLRGHQESFDAAAPTPRKPSAGRPRRLSGYAGAAESRPSVPNCARSARVDQGAVREGGSPMTWTCTSTAVCSHGAGRCVYAFVAGGR